MIQPAQWQTAESFFLDTPSLLSGLLEHYYLPVYLPSYVVHHPSHPYISGLFQDPVLRLVYYDLTQELGVSAARRRATPPPYERYPEESLKFKAPGAEVEITNRAAISSIPFKGLYMIPCLICVRGLPYPRADFL